MASIGATRSASRHTQLSVSGAMKKLLSFSKLIQYRESVKPHEAKRIQDAFTLIGRPEERKEATSQATERREGYRWLLKKVQAAAGPQLVILCVIGLGQSAVGGMRDRVRMEFLSEIKNQENVLKCAALQKLAEEYFDVSSPRQPQPNDNWSFREHQRENVDERRGPLAGDVYELTSADLQTLATSDQVHGQILLTDPYEQSCSPFITISISANMKNHFTTQRLRIM